MEKKKSGFGTAALVLSIIGIVFCFIPFINFISYILCGIALIFAIVSLIKKSSKGMSIAAIIICILSFFIASVMNTATTEAIKETSKEVDKITGNSTEEVLKESFNVSLGEFKAVTDQYGLTDTELVVTVKNISNKKLSGSIHIEAVDSNGNRLEDDYVYISDLNAGQTTTDKVFDLISSEKVESLKNAKFNIVEASAY